MKSEREALKQVEFLDDYNSVYSQSENPETKRFKREPVSPLSPLKRPIKVDIKVIFDNNKRFFAENWDYSLVERSQRYMQRCVDSYPVDELQVSNSNLINQVLIKPDFFAIVTYETGLSIYRLKKNSGTAVLLGRESSSLFMYLRVDISQDLKHIFSFKYNLAFEYSVFDKETKTFKVRQDVGSMLTKGGNVNGVVDLKYCDHFRILAAVVRLDDAVSLFTFELRYYDGKEKLKLIEKVPDSNFARTLAWASWGRHVVVGFDYDQDLGKKDENDSSPTRRGGRLSFLQNLLCNGKRMSKYFPKTSIKAYRVDRLTKKMTICFNFPVLPNHRLVNIKMLRLCGDSQIMMSLSTSGVLAIWKRAKTQENDTTRSSLRKKASSVTSDAENKTIDSTGLQYDLVKTLEIKTSPIELIDLSFTGNLVSVVLKNGQVKTFIRNKTSSEVQFDLLARSYSEGSSVKHCYFTKDDKRLIYEFKSGVLKSEKIRDLKKRAQFVESGQIISYGENWKVNWLEFMNSGENLLASIRDLRGSGEEYKTEFFERNEKGEYEKILGIEGNAYKFSLSGDGLMFCCVKLPSEFHKFVRKSKKHDFEEVKFDLMGKEPYAVLIFPDSKDLVISTNCLEILFYQYLLVKIKSKIFFKFFFNFSNFFS